MTTIEFELVDASARDALRRLQAAQSNLSPLMVELAGHLHAIVERAFEDETDPSTGEHWPMLQAKTIKRREKLGYWPGKMLQRTGELVGSAVPESGDDYAEVVVGAPYAQYQQFGTRHIPKRAFLGIDAAGEEDIVRSTLDYLRAALDAETP